MTNPFIQPNMLEVDDYFKRGAIMPFFPGGPFKDIEEMRSSFSDKDRLTVFEAREGVYEVLCRVEDLEYLTARRDIADKLLLSRGLKFDDLDKLSPDDLFALRVEIDAACKASGLK